MEESVRLENWVFLSVMIVLLSYHLRFTEATQAMGRELSDTDSPTGFQDAITPPWQTNLGMIAIGGTLLAIGVIWWETGWLLGLVAIFAVLVGLAIVRAMLPKANAPHFRDKITRSMARRYADYKRDGDQVRADAMHALLKKSGVSL